MSMRLVKPTSYLLVWGVMTALFSSTSCGTAERQHASPQHETGNFLVGAWDAEWSASPELSDDPMGLKMHGKIDFQDNGEVEIIAYGFEGCIFMSDTMTNNLSYTIEGNVVNLHAEGDAFGLPYQVKEKQNNEVKLLLMDDIWLTLTRDDKVAKALK